MVLFSNLLELVDVDKLGELIKMKHVFVLAVFAEERDIFTQIHVLYVICNKASIAALDALAEFADDVSLGTTHNYVCDSNTRMGKAI